MINKQAFFRTIYIYVISYFVLLLAILGLLYLYPKPELHLLLNSHHSNLQDTFFKYYTLLAEWPLYALALFPLLWKKIKMTLFFAMCELTGGALLQILKHLFSFDRPVSVFEHSQNLVLPLVQGVNMHHGNSFPSGHASTFFMFCTCIVIFRPITIVGKANHTTSGRGFCFTRYRCCCWSLLPWAPTRASISPSTSCRMCAWAASSALLHRS